LPRSTLTDSSTDHGAKQPRSIQVLVGWRIYINGQVGQQEGQPALTFSDNAGEYWLYSTKQQNWPSR